MIYKIKKRLRRQTGLILTMLICLAMLLTATGCGAGSNADSFGIENTASGYAPGEQAGESESASGEQAGASETASDEQAGASETALDEQTAESEGASGEQAGQNENLPGLEEADDDSSIKTAADEPILDPLGTYTSKEDVALYIHLYGELPSNFMTKKEAQELGWSGGSLEKYAPGKCIGGSRFGNYEGLLPEADGRSYRECDIDTLGAKSRGAKRIVYSNDGLIYYTGDHYESFELLYGEE